MRQKAAYMIALGIALIFWHPARAAEPSVLLKAMQTELDRSYKALAHADEVPLYYLSYHVTDKETRNISATYGAISSDNSQHDRIFDLDLRVGDRNLDNTKEIRDEDNYYFDDNSYTRLPLEDDPLAIRTIIWQKTDETYRQALERYTKVKTSEQVLAEREDTSADFSVEPANKFIGQPAAATLDGQSWEERLRGWSAIFKEYPFVQTSSVELSLSNDNRYFVDTDGSALQTGQSYARLFLRCSGSAPDGMEIDRYQSFDSDTTRRASRRAGGRGKYPQNHKGITGAYQRSIGRAVHRASDLVNRASGVFFHEIFGHRIEGHRQKSENEGQLSPARSIHRYYPSF